MFSGNHIILLLCFLIFIASSSVAQPEDPDSTATSVKIDLLRAPSSPAANLLNMAPSDIEKPTDINAFMFSLRNATNSFTALPTNYAFEVAPFQIFNRTKPLDSRTLVENRENFRRSFVLSAGVKKVESNDSVAGSKKKTQLGLGIKFAVKRSGIDEKSKQAFAAIWSLQQSLNETYANIQKLIVYKDEKYVGLTREIDVIVANKTLTTSEKAVLMRPLFQQREKRNQEIIDQIRLGIIDTAFVKAAYYAQAIDSVKKLISEEVKHIKLERNGFNADFAAGTVIDFLDNSMGQSYMFKTGAWLTGGWTTSEMNNSALFIFRYLYNPATSLFNPELIMQNTHNLDFGGRVVLTMMQKKLLISGEAMYRSVLNDSDIPSSWRFMLNAEYEIGINQRLSFSFGKHFDGTYYKAGNIIGAVNLLFGLGNQAVNAGLR